MDFPSDNVQVPKPQTLKKYGLTEQDWRKMYALQRGLCPICKRPLEKPVIDHLHVKNWKKMKPDKRRQYVRGVPCNYCNRRRLARGMTLEIAKSIVDYLEQFEKRKPK